MKKELKNNIDLNQREVYNNCKVDCVNPDGGMQKMKCAIYIRVSTDRDEQKTSLETQKNMFIQYLTENNFDLYDFYVDIQSGTKAKRPALQKLIEDAKEKKFDMILAKELSRLARNGALSYEIKNICTENRIHMITLDGAINTLANASDMFGIYAWVYEQESKNNSNRQKAAKQTAAKMGKFIGTIAPYGYYLKDKKLYIREDNSAEIVKRIFKEYLSGRGFDAIARGLLKDNIPTTSMLANKSNATTVWHGSAVRAILENQHYIGDLVQGKSSIIEVTSNKRNITSKDNRIIYENAHEAIISKETYLLTQELIATRRRVRPSSNNHLFSNILYCADCGHRLHFKANRKGYVCGSFNKHGDVLCTSHIVREKDLINLILTDFNSLHQKFKSKSFELAKSKINKKKLLFEKKLNSIDINLKTLNNKKNNALDKFLADMISKEAYDSVVNRTDKEINLLNTEKKTIIKSLDSLSNINQNYIEKIKIELSDITELTHSLLIKLIDKIEVKENGDLRINYKFSNLLN